LDLFHFHSSFAVCMLIGARA